MTFWGWKNKFTYNVHIDIEIYFINILNNNKLLKGYTNLKTTRFDKMFNNCFAQMF